MPWLSVKQSLDERHVVTMHSWDISSLAEFLQYCQEHALPSNIICVLIWKLFLTCLENPFWKVNLTRNVDSKTTSTITSLGG